MEKIPHVRPFRAYAAILRLLLAFAVFSPDLNAQNKNEAALKQVLKQMEAVSKSFRGFAADFSKKKYTEILDLYDTPESGEFYYSRADDGSTLLREEVKKPAPKITTVKDGIVKIYEPRINQAKIHQLGKYRNLLEEYTAHIHAPSPATLQEVYNISYLGSESIEETQCWILLLEPKSSDVKAYIKSITLWIKNTNAIVIQYRLEEPNQDFLQVNYFAEKLNPKIDKSKFEQQLPSRVKITPF